MKAPSNASIDWSKQLQAAIVTYLSNKTTRAQIFNFFGATNHAHAHQNTCNIILNEFQMNPSNVNAAVLFFALLKYLTVHRNSTEFSNILFDRYKSITDVSRTETLKNYLSTIKKASQQTNSPRKSSYESFDDVMEKNYETMIKAFLPQENSAKDLHKPIEAMINKLIENLPVQKQLTNKTIEPSGTISSYESFAV